MNRRNTLEDQLESIGAALRSRPSLSDRVMTQVRSAVAEDAVPAAPAVLQVQPRRRFLRSAMAAAVAIAAAALVAILFPSPSAIGCAQVAEALKAQKWIRGQVTYANGKQGTVWISPKRQLWALKLDPSVSFFDGREYAKYEYRGGAEPITKLPLGEADAERVLPLEAIAADKDRLGPWLLGETILQQQRREVTENGETWIEFQLTLARGDITEGTLRVDPKTKLPVYLMLTSREDKTKVTKFVFDYPAEGPADIYALGVPREAKIDELVPLKTTAELLKAVAASRAKIGAFQLIVGHPLGGFGDAPVYPASLVTRDGDRWRVDGCLPPDMPGAVPPPAGAGWDLWAADQVKRSTLVPLFACDGRTIWENTVFPETDGFNWQVSKNAAPQSLMSGEGLGSLNLARHIKFAGLLYPDLSPRRGWSFEIDTEPKDHPGCVLVKRSGEVTAPEPRIAHEWYYVDPAKGHAVVQIELFSVVPGRPAIPANSKSRQTIEMRDFQQAPAGWWYCTELVDTMSSLLAEDPPRRTTIRYAFDFAPSVREFGPAPIK